MKQLWSRARGDHCNIKPIRQTICDTVVWDDERDRLQSETEVVVELT